MSSPTTRPAASLARATLLKMGVRIAIVIALTTLVSYLHMLNTLRQEALQQMERHVTERSQREQAIFVLAEDNHALLKKAMEERLRAMSEQDPNPRFDSLFARLPDGTIRNRPESFDGKRMVGLLVNLLSNAKYAMDDTPVEQRRLRVAVERSGADRVRIEVRDQGTGIAPEMLTLIFQYGFTTRKEGHGFGLHSSALAAQELGGALSVHSDGPGQGATFTLELPYRPVEGVNRT
jgi:signal transduction histidine kinase